MRLNSFIKYNFKADFYSYTVSRDTEGGEIRNYFLVRPIQLKVVTGSTGVLNIFLSDEDDDVVTGARLINIIDAGGKPFRAQGVWELEYSEPEINLWGYREGFRGRAVWIGLAG